jgi:hypothetical protein
MNAPHSAILGILSTLVVFSATVLTEGVLYTMPLPASSRSMASCYRTIILDGNLYDRSRPGSKYAAGNDGLSASDFVFVQGGLGFIGNVLDYFSALIGPDERCRKQFMYLGLIFQERNRIAKINAHTDSSNDSWKFAAICYDISPTGLLPVRLALVDENPIPIQNKYIRSLKINQGSLGNSDRFFGQNCLAPGDINQNKSKDTHRDGCKGVNCPVVGFQKAYDSPEEISRNINHRSPLIPWGFVFVFFAILILGWLLATG